MHIDGPTLYTNTWLLPLFHQWVSMSVKKADFVLVFPPILVADFFREILAFRAKKSIIVLSSAGFLRKFNLVIFVLDDLLHLFCYDFIKVWLVEKKTWLF